jgi:zinc/manganese transport system ATP-binding protein
MDCENNHTAIATQHLDLGYDGRPIVSNMSISINKGEFIGILGPNGSGKSTFLRALLGLIKPLSGQISILGKTPTRGNCDIGYMPQMRSHISITNLTSRALLEAACDGLCLGTPIVSKEMKAKIQQLLEMVGATAYADRTFKQLSGGEKQRIYLAQALLGDPAILLLDEPLSNLDPKYQDIFIVLLNNIQKNLNVTILFTAHDPNPLLNIMSRVLFFANGKAALGNTSEVITSQRLSEMYGTQIEVLHFRDKLFVLSETQQNILGEVRHHHD